MQFVAPWSDARRMRVHVSYERFRAMLARLIRESLPGISPRPQDYRVTAFGVLGEVFAGTTTANEVALGASVAGLQLTEVHREVAPVPVVEFYNAALDHYFISSRADDIDALDSGRLRGWTRTGAAFAAWPGYVAGAVPVCRYYLPPKAGDSHFLSGADDECRAVAARHPEFVLEEAEAMYVVLPDRATGQCPDATRAVYRLWNARPATNHRYTTEAATRQQMIEAGWMPEGYGDLGVAMCAPSIPVSAGASQAAG